MIQDTDCIIICGTSGWRGTNTHTHTQRERERSWTKILPELYMKSCRAFMWHCMVACAGDALVQILGLTGLREEMTQFLLETLRRLLMQTRCLL